MTGGWTHGLRAGCWMVALVALVALGCGDDVAPADGAVSCTSDAECDDGIFCNGPEVCDPGSVRAAASGCVPTPGLTACGTTETCDETMDVCLEGCDDADGDGAADIACGGSDCDDLNPYRYPTNLEVCDADGVDEDCDPTTFGDKDQDGDGTIDALCCNGDTCGTDCDDTKAGISVGATEACNGFDDDCDGDVDEGVAMAGYVDADRDLHGDPMAPLTACPGTVGFSTLGDDCDDTTTLVHGAQVELCDGVDNDCNGLIDDGTTSATWYVDRDGDGYGDPGETRESCDLLIGFSLLDTDCDDTDPAVSPVAAEACNGLDDDCNGLADFRLGVNDFEDDDGDGYVDAACVPAPAMPDCDDFDSDRYLTANESCDGRDNDCDGRVDEACGGTTCPPGTDSTTPECEPVTCAANQRVVSHRCVACPTGYESDAGADASGPNTTCTDIDECGDGADDCTQLCMNTVGGFRCACSSGALAVDGRSCVMQQVYASVAGMSDMFVVPTGVTELFVELRGGSGGSTGTSGAPGGRGGITTGVLPVTPGETLFVTVGGAGSQPVAGYNGGGTSGTSSAVQGGSGGGASTLSRGSTRLMVAGGGGGAGHPSSPGGDGGGETASDGGANAAVLGNGTPGRGATPLGGGAGGTGPVAGGSGMLAFGGDTSRPDGHSGGAGGGGRFGGGGGGGADGGGFAAGGGGGGSSFAAPSVIDPVLTRGGNQGIGRVTLGWVAP